MKKKWQEKWNQIKKRGHERLSFMIVPHNESHIINIQLSKFTIWFALGVVFLIIVSSILSWQLQTKIKPTVESLHDRHDSLYRERSLYIAKLDNLSERQEYLRKKIEDIYSEIEMENNDDLLFLNSKILYGRAKSEIENEKIMLIRYEEKKGEINFSKNIINEIIRSDDDKISDDFNFYPEVTEYREMALEVNQLIEAISEINHFVTKRIEVQKKLPYYWPTRGGHFTSFYGPRLSPFGYKTDFHYGVDLANPLGTPIYSTADGVVERTIYTTTGYGYYVEIKHGFGFETLYAHMSRIDVRAGQYVRKGQVIGAIGSTGNSTGAHLHYEVHIYGDRVNPIHYLNY